MKPLHSKHSLTSNLIPSEEELTQTIAHVAATNPRKLPEFMLRTWFTKMMAKHINQSYQQLETMVEEFKRRFFK